MLVLFRPFIIAATLLLIASAPAIARASGTHRQVAHLSPAAGKSSPSAGLLRDALLAGGADPEQASVYSDKLQHLTDRLQTSIATTRDKRQRAAAIHRFLHKELLCGPYRESPSDLAATLDGGAFNCVTASTLFLALAAECDLDAWAVEVPGHVWCRVTTPDGPVDVETTCPNWFELADEHRAKEARSARALDSSGVVALYHYNRGVRLLRDERFCDAALANLAALRLDRSCEAAYDNLLATMNNWSVHLAARGQSDLALQLLAVARRLAPDYEPFRVNHSFVAAQQSNP